MRPINRLHSWNGDLPEIRLTPWGQKVFYDRNTYVDAQKSIWRLEGKSWKQMEPLVEELENKIEIGEIRFQRRAARLAKGLWLIDVDGQQNIYLLESSNGLTLIDPSLESTTDVVIDQIKSLGFDPGDVQNILLTHCHVDHAQSAAYWQKKGAEVFIHDADKNAILTGNEITAWWLINDEKHRHFPPVREVTSIFDGDVLTLGEHQIYACHTPGHTPGSTCFYLQLEGKHILISGDTIFHNGKHGWTGHPYVDYDLYLKSLWKLKSFAVGGVVHHEKDRIMVREPIKFDMLLPGHTAISLDMVSRDIEKGLEIMSYTVQKRREGENYQWTEPYTFFAEQIATDSKPIILEFR
jgi:glyoxylase-like metal-dependent hydrolase (beta-lactamase superfamily II)